MDDFWAGQEEFLGGNYSKAIKHYRTAYKTFSSMPENERTDEFLALIMSNCAAAEMRLEMSRKVVESCNQALTFDETCIRAYLLKGCALRKQGRLDQAQTVWASGLEKCRHMIEDIELLDELRRLAANSESECKEKSEGKLLTGQVKKRDKTTVTDSKMRVKVVSKEANKAVAASPLEQLALRRLAAGRNTDLAHGFLLVNQGQLERAIEKFSHIISDKPQMAEAYVGRGSAYAMKRLLLEAQDDFSTAIEKDSNNAEAWKRRGQVRAAMGDHTAALDDFKEAQKRSKKDSCETEKELGMVYHSLMDYKTALVHFRKAEQLLLEQDTLSAQLGKKIYNGMGMCQTSLGNPIAAIGAYATSIDLDPDLAEAYANMGQAYKEYANFDKAEECFLKAIALDPKHVTVHYVRGCLYHGSGLTHRATEMFTAGLENCPNHDDTLYMRGVSYQSLGQYRKAWDDFNSVVSRKPNHFAFYQRDLCLLSHHDLDKSLMSFNPDADYDRDFKEAWTKGLDPDKFNDSYKPPPPFDESIPDVTIPERLSEEMAAVLEVSNHFGGKLQYNTPGFLKNHRQHRQSGLAIISIAQKCRDIWHKMKVEDEAGLTASGESSSYTKEAHRFGWRDMADIMVQWRQISEPNDAVWWVDQLDSETFTHGYGSETPIVNGQCNVVRYYPYFKMAFPLLKQLIEDRFKSSPQKVAQVLKAETCEDLYKVLGHDFYASTSCYSQAVPDRVMEGTRLTIQKELPYGFTFSIRTPVTPSRWKQYDEEMACAFEAICQAAIKEEKDTQILVELVLTFAFYWYNFMPLARGTASCGLVAINGLLLAFGLEITNPIPKGLQVDWEAILRSSREDFISQITTQWIRKSIKPVVPDALESLPSTEKTFPSLRSVIEVLNFQL